MKKSLRLSHVVLFWKKYFSINKYILRERPGTNEIVFFLKRHKIVCDDVHKNILAEFIWEFWNKKDLLKLGSDKLKSFLKKHNLT
jgi:hypothetical protein